MSEKVVEIAMLDERRQRMMRLVFRDIRKEWVDGRTLQYWSAIAKAGCSESMTVLESTTGAYRIAPKVRVQDGKKAWNIYRRKDSPDGEGHFELAYNDDVYELLECLEIIERDLKKEGGRS